MDTLVWVDFFLTFFRPLMFCLDIMFVVRVVCQICVVNCIGMLYFHAVFFYLILFYVYFVDDCGTWLFAYILLYRCDC